MRKTLTIFFILLSVLAFGQSETHNMTTYDTIIPYRGPNNNGQMFVVRITRPANFFNPGSPDTASRPVIMTMQGSGQVSNGTYTFNNAFGPHYWLANGWNGSVVLGNGTHYPILWTVQANAVNMKAPFYQSLFDTLYKEFHPRSVHYAGLSDGVEMGGWLLTYQSTLGDEHVMARIQSFTNLSGVAPSFPAGENEQGAQPLPYPEVWGYWADKYHGKYWATLGNTDNQQSTYLMEQMINDSVPGAAYFSWVDIGGSGAHCCWNTMYDPTQLNWTNQATFGNANITTNGNAANTAGNYTYSATTGTSWMQWALRQGDTTLVPGYSLPALPWTMFMGEYAQPAIYNNGVKGIPYMFSQNLASTGNNNAGVSGIPQGVVSNPNSAIPSMALVSNTLHGSTFIDVSGNVWVMGGIGQGENGIGNLAIVDTLTPILTDSRGVAFTGIFLTVGAYVQADSADTYIGQFFVKRGSASDTVYWSGHSNYGMSGNGLANDSVYLRPTIMFSLPLSGSSATRIIAMTSGGITGIVLSDGTVRTFGYNQFSSAFGRTITGSNYASPQPVTGITSGDSIRQIAGGGAPGLMALGKSGTLYGTTAYTNYMGGTPGIGTSTFSNLTSYITDTILKGTSGMSITQIASNSSTFHFLRSDSTLWGCGDAGQGDIGNGVQANMASPGGSSSPWFLDIGAIGILWQTRPVQVTNKHNFYAIFNGNLATHTFAALATDGLYYAGRNKFGVIPNGMLECDSTIGTLGAYYPNSWQMPYLSKINPLTVTSRIFQTCPGCASGAVTAHCSSCGVTTSATANAGSNQTLASGITTTQLNGTSSFSTGGVIPSWQYIWTQTSGPASTIDVQASPAPNITFSGNGTYVYNLTVTDQGFNTNSSSVTITVGSVTQTVSPIHIIFR